ncbi:MAG TPA: dihydroxyacetone kinase subunit L [Candidatus Pullichristensenella avicola]|nr:dihydroxyacetone kinase subunit L [Candidatus Pullichristensenella avicola]
MEKITMAELTALFDSVAAIMAENAERLCAMDANMGDGDLGLTMKKGFGALPGLIADIDEADLGKRLAKAGMKMSSVVPSTMGTLMSSGVMEGGKRLSGCEAIGPAEFAGFLEGYAAGIQKRGKCQRGDRTVLDAIGPAADAAAQAAAQPGATLVSVAEAAVRGADEGVIATRDMTPKFGKAAVFAARAAGVEDQGAVAGQLVVRGLANYIRGGK